MKLATLFSSSMTRMRIPESILSASIVFQNQEHKGAIPVYLENDGIGMLQFGQLITEGFDARNVPPIVDGMNNVAFLQFITEVARYSGMCRDEHSVWKPELQIFAYLIVNGQAENTQR